MKLILTQEVDGLGSPGDVVEVKDGYGRNYLVPRGLATRWTRGGQKTIDAIVSARGKRAARDRRIPCLFSNDFLFASGSHRPVGRGRGIRNTRQELDKHDSSVQVDAPSVYCRRSRRWSSMPIIFVTSAQPRGFRRAFPPLDGGGIATLRFNCGER